MLLSNCNIKLYYASGKLGLVKYSCNFFSEHQILYSVRPLNKKIKKGGKNGKFNFGIKHTPGSRFGNPIQNLGIGGIN